MQIANPLYDVVFKYLLSDAKIAKLLISKIIEQEISELEFLPTEKTVKMDRGSWTVFRMDFAASIVTPEGPRQVIIELQKAKYASDIMRFRRYLGKQYAEQEKPIVSIYFLGHALEAIKEPLIQVKRQYISGLNGAVLAAKDQFIEGLTHDSFVIQVPFLQTPYRNDTEALLSVFNQVYKTKGDGHFLQMNADEYPEKYARVIRRLQQAAAEIEVRETMDVEDEVLEQLENLERSLERKDQMLQETQQALHKKDQVIHEKDQALAEKERELLALKKRLVDFEHSAGR